MDSGFGATITFSLASGVLLYEKQITPHSIQGGGKIDTTTHRNTAWRTSKPKSLKDVGDMSLTVAYDPAVISTMMSMVGANQQITAGFPDGSTWSFWGFIDSFVPSALDVNEDQPTAALTLMATNLNDSDVETAPAFTTAP